MRIFDAYSQEDMPIRSDGEETRSRILRAAGEEFGRRGFYHVTNQDISVKSGANSAAISYYFRDKAGLYREVWSFLQARSAEIHLYWMLHDCADVAAMAPAELKERFVQLAGSLLDWILDGDSWDSEIMAYEREASTGLIDVDCDAVCSPLKKELCRVWSAAYSQEEGDSAAALRIEMLEADIRICCRKGREWNLHWDRDAIFDCAVGSYLKDFPEESKWGGDEEPPVRRKSVRRTQASRDDVSQLELGVTDEVDPFELKPVTLEDLSHMARLQEAARQKEKEERMIEEDAPPIVRTDSDHSFFQTELF